MSNRTYTEGQAVIFISSNETHLGFATGGEYPVLGYQVVNLLGTHHTYIGDDSRPATEAEILNEAAKNGWKANKYQAYLSPESYIKIRHNGVKWEFKLFPAEFNETLLGFGNECIVAHRLITALNLAK